MDNCTVKPGWFAPVLFASLVSVNTAATALQVNGDVGVDLRYTDNAALVDVNESDDLITTATIGASVSEDQGPLTGSAKATLRYLDYLDNTFDNQTYLRLDAAAGWEQIRDLLRWDVKDYFSQSSIDNLASDTPNNTEDINAFNIGASLTLRPAGRHTVVIVPSFKDFYYETSDDDNQQTGVEADWSYQLYPGVTVSLAGGFRDVNYDNDTLNSDYTSTAASVGATVLRARSEYKGSVGITSIDRDSGPGFDGVTGRLDALYKLTARSSVNAILLSELTDASDVYLSTSLDPNAGNFGNIQISNDVLRNSLLRVKYGRTGSTVDFSTWIEWRDLNYQTTPDDRKVQEYGARLGYKLSPRMTASVSGRYIHTDQTKLALTDKYYQAGGMLGYALSRRLNARAGVQFRNRDNTNPLDEYNEYSVFASLGYHLGR